MTYLTILFFLFISTILILVVACSLKNGIGPMPTSPKVKNILLEHLPAVSGIIYELGSGWGTLTFSLSKKYPQCKLIAFENSPIPYLFSKIRHLFFRSNRLQIKWQNFYHVDLHEVDMIVCYLYPGAMLRLKTQFEKELKQGCWVVSHTFAVPGWKPYKTYETNDMYRTKIYIYKI